MRKLNLMNATLLCEGAKTEGTFTDGFEYAVEQVKVKHAEPLRDFCKWLDEKVGGASIHNIQLLYDCYKHPNNTVGKIYVKRLRQRILDIEVNL